MITMLRWSLRTIIEDSENMEEDWQDHTKTIENNTS